MRARVTTFNDTIFHNISIPKILMVLYIFSVPLLAAAESTAKLSQALGAILAGTFIVVVLKNEGRFRLPAELVTFGVFLVYVVFGGLFARESGVVVSRFVTLAQLWILTVVLFNLLTTDGRAHLLGFWSYAVGVLVAAVYSVTTTESITGRFAGTFENPNGWGLTLVLAIGSLLLLPTVKRSTTLVHGGILALFMWQIALTGSRKAILGGLAILAMYGVAVLRQNVRRPIRAAAIVVLIAVIGTSVLGWLQTTPYWQRVANFGFYLQGQQVEDGSINMRARLMAAGIELWKSNPIIGLGADQYRYHVEQMGLRQTYSHSNPVEILANFGIVGFTLYFSIYLGVTWRIWRAWKAQKHSRQNRSAILVAAGLWGSWVALEGAHVAYLSKAHWMAVALLLAMTSNMMRASKTESPRDVPIEVKG